MIQSIAMQNVYNNFLQNSRKTAIQKIFSCENYLNKK